MDIVGLGLDIVEIERVRKLALKNKRFLKRVFSPEEIRYCETKKKKWQHFAVRFAAKEAVWKALGRDGLALSAISVRRDARGRPSVKIAGKKPAGKLEISLSHSEVYAMAVAMAYRS